MHNNCVVMPGLGGFVANPIPAKIDYSRGIISPPTKALTFNISLTNNDGLVVTALAKHHNLTYENALERVAGFAKSSSAALQQGERIVFPNVGFLFQNSSGKISFEQDRFFNLLLSSYGLGNVEFIPEKEIETIENEHTSKEIVGNKTPESNNSDDSIENADKKSLTPVVQLQPETNNTQKPKTSGVKKLLRYAAVAALTPIAFYSFWIPMNTDVLQSGVIYKEDFNPFKKKATEVYQKSSLKDIESVDISSHESLINKTKNLPYDVAVYSFGLTEELFIPVRIRSSVTKNKEIEEHSSSSFKNSYSYYLIVGAFSDKNNAESLVNDFKDQGYQDTQILDHKNGLHRVAILGKNNRKEAKKVHQELKDIGISSWILSK